MQLNTITNPYYFKCLIKNHANKFSEFDQKFLISMLTSLTNQREVTAKQFDYCERLIQQLKTHEELV